MRRQFRELPFGEKPHDSETLGSLPVLGPSGPAPVSTNTLSRSGIDCGAVSGTGTSSGRSEETDHEGAFVHLQRSRF